MPDASYYNELADRTWTARCARKPPAIERLADIVTPPSQLDALDAACCREVVETASSRDARPKLHATIARLRAGDTLVIYKPDRVARSMKELLVLLEDELHARGLGLHRRDGATIADKMLFMVAAMAAEMERELIRERTLDGLRAAEAQGRRGGRPRVPVSAVGRVNRRSVRGAG